MFWTQLLAHLAVLNVSQRLPYLPRSRTLSIELLCSLKCFILQCIPQFYRNLICPEYIKPVGDSLHTHESMLSFPFSNVKQAVVKSWDSYRLYKLGCGDSKLVLCCKEYGSSPENSSVLKDPKANIFDNVISFLCYLSLIAIPSAQYSYDRHRSLYAHRSPSKLWRTSGWLALLN